MGGQRLNYVQIRAIDLFFSSSSFLKFANEINYDESAQQKKKPIFLFMIIGFINCRYWEQTSNFGCPEHCACVCFFLISIPRGGVKRRGKVRERSYQKILRFLDAVLTAFQFIL